MYRHRIELDKCSPQLVLCARVVLPRLVPIICIAVQCDNHNSGRFGDTKEDDVDRCKSNRHCSAPISNVSIPSTPLYSQVTRQLLTIDGSVPSHKTIVPISLVWNLSPNTPGLASLDPDCPLVAVLASYSRTTNPPSLDPAPPTVPVLKTCGCTPNTPVPATYVTATPGPASAPTTPVPASTHAASADPLVSCAYATCVDIERVASLLSYIVSSKRPTVDPLPASAGHLATPILQDHFSNGFPVEAGPEWSLPTIRKAIAKGPIPPTSFSPSQPSI